MQAGNEPGGSLRDRPGWRHLPPEQDASIFGARWRVGPNQTSRQIAGATLTRQNGSGKVGELPRELDLSRRGVGCGERLFLENSTGCLISQCHRLFFSLAISLIAGLDFPRFLLESLILAQDERWRRA